MLVVNKRVRGFTVLGWQYTAYRPIILTARFMHSLTSGFTRLTPMREREKHMLPYHGHGWKAAHLLRKVAPRILPELPKSWKQANLFAIENKVR